MDWELETLNKDVETEELARFIPRGRRKLPKGFKERYYLTYREAREIVKAWSHNKEVAEVNLDLGYTDRKFKVYVHRETVYFPQVGVEVPYKKIAKIVRKEDESVYLITPEGLEKIVFSDGDRVYRMLATIPPGLELNGIRMHSREIGKEIKQKLDILRVRRGERVLDLCTGFGYTAIEAAKRGGRVTTVEIDENVIELAKLNPYSLPLFTDKNIQLVIGDAIEFVKSQPEEVWDVIIHDPPRLGKSSGDLYSTDLYKHLYRILKPFGRLYHYTGSPGSKYKRRDLPHTIAKRLADVGFKVRRVSEIHGIIAVKSLSVL